VVEIPHSEEAIAAANRTAALHAMSSTPQIMQQTSQGSKKPRRLLPVAVDNSITTPNEREGVAVESTENEWVLEAVTPFGNGTPSTSTGTEDSTDKEDHRSADSRTVPSSQVEKNSTNPETNNTVESPGIPLPGLMEVDEGWILEPAAPSSDVTDTQKKQGQPRHHHLQPAGVINPHPPVVSPQPAGPAVVVPPQPAGPTVVVPPQAGTTAAVLPPPSLRPQPAVNHPRQHFHRARQAVHHTLGNHLPRRLKPARVISGQRQAQTVAKATRMLKQKLRRRENTIKILKAQVESMKRDLKNEDVFEKAFSGGFSSLLKRKLLKVEGKLAPNTPYSMEAKEFSLLFHAHDPRGYRFMRKQGLPLPCERTLRHWVAKGDYSPGFIAAALNALRAFAEKSAKGKIVTNLVIDEMNLRPQIDLYKGRNVGTVDLGDGLTEDFSAAGTSQTPMAKQALVLMLVGVNESFKIPIYYALIDGLNARARADIINAALRKLSELEKVEVMGVTGDGAQYFLFEKLGVNMEEISRGSTDEIHCSFPHPDPARGRVFAFLDPSHLLKLARNLLGEKQEVIWGEDRVQWAFIEYLHKLQKKEGLRLANRLTDACVNFRKVIQKVGFAAKTLSGSVASALEFLRESKVREFLGSEATSSWIRIINDLFDIMNSKNCLNRG
jgi:Transposase protein